MIDSKILRERPEEVLAIYRDRLFDEAVTTAQEVLKVDAERRKLLAAADELKAKRNTLHRRPSGVKKDEAKRAAAIKEMEGVKAEIAALDEKLVTIEADFERLMLLLPNLPASNVPTGKSDAENTVSREHGERRSFDFAPKPHWEIGEGLGILDFERGVKISGTRFYVLKGAGARLQRALIAWMIDVHVEQGYTEIYPPTWSSEACLFGTAQLPSLATTCTATPRKTSTFHPDGGSAGHQPLSRRDPRCRVAAREARGVSACFRREKMAAGRDTRGMKRAISSTRSRW